MCVIQPLYTAYGSLLLREYYVIWVMFSVFFQEKSTTYSCTALNSLHLKRFCTYSMTYTYVMRNRSARQSPDGANGHSAQPRCVENISN
jgi:hypothetical protein